MTQTIPKWCPRCQKFKEPAEFYKHRGRADGLTSYCKKCTSVYARERKREHPRKTRTEIDTERLRRVYGLTFEQYEKMRWDQNGLCAICGQPQKEGHGNKLYVDHSHRTGKVRALLCSLCNAGLGQFGDDIERLESAVRYLKYHSS